nr:MAG TPA: hypothetical protein [Caudoviricetes sp.]
MDAKKEDFVKIILRKIVDFVKKIFWTEPWRNLRLFIL